MLKILYIILSFSIIGFALAQPITFEKYYDFGFGEGSSNIIQTYGGGYAIAASQGIAIGSSKAIALKIDSVGTEEWTTFAGSSSDRYGEAIVQENDSSYVMTGAITGSAVNERDIYLLKLNKNGDTLWSKFYGGAQEDAAVSLKNTYDNGYILAGATNSYGMGQADAYIIKTNSVGDTLWTRTWGGIDIDVAKSVIETKDSGFVACGYSASFNNGILRVFLVKYDKEGDFLWEKFFTNSASANWGFSVKELADGNLIIGGIVYYDSQYDILLIRTDSSGNEIWKKSYGTNMSENINSVALNLSDSSIIMAGGYPLPANPSVGNILLMKVTKDGDSLWSRLYGGDKNSEGRSVISDTDGGFVIAGMRSNSPTADIYVIKTDSNGCVVSGCDTIPFPYSNIISNKEILSFILYPNPASDKIILQFNLLNDSYLQSAIYDVLGQKVMDGKNELLTKGENYKTFKTGNLVSGIYFIKIILNSELVKTEKIIIR